uniref:Sulfotransferase n=1 Tax=Kalanchoe fedtschenkoi TaxID=63787 RepID=A0A7N0ZXE9_KALFE
MGMSEAGEGASEEAKARAPEYMRDEKLSEECKMLLPHLPKTKGWVGHHLYKYEGFWHNNRHLDGLLSYQRHFSANDGDVLLVTTPKSGTTWLKAAVFSIVNRVCHPPGSKNHPLLTENPHGIVPFIELQYYGSMPDFTNMPLPRLFSSHSPVISLPKSVQESHCKIIYLCRNPRDTFVSFWHFTNKLRTQAGAEATPIEETLNMFCNGESLCGPFWDHVVGYWNASLKKPDKVMFLRYEEVRAHPDEYFKKMAEFLGCPISEEEKGEGIVEELVKLCSFDHLSNLEVNKTGTGKFGEANNAFFRRGQAGDSANYFTSEMIDKLDKVTYEKFSPYGLIM